MSSNMKPNFTQLSNYFIDKKMKSLKGGSVLVYIAVTRKTIGWHKDTDAICYDQIQALTGLAKTSIAAAIKELENNGLIQVDRAYKQANRYTLIFEDEFSSSISGVQKLDAQKKNNTKEKDNKGVPPYSEGFLKFLNFWNTFFDDKELEFKPSKHDPVKPTQVLADSYLFYRELKNGIFVSNHPAVKDMLFKMGIDKKLFSRKLTDDEMLQCLKNCVLQYLPNYWPESVSDKKKILPKSLSTTILNARNLSCPSVFLKLFYRPPTPIAQGIKLPANLQPAASYAIRALNESGIYDHDLTDAEQDKVKKAIKEIAAKREDYIDRVGQVYKQDKRGNYFEAVVGYNPDDEKEICGFVKHYCAYLETEHERLADFFEEKGIKGSTVPVNQIAPSGQKSKWHGFLRYCDDEFKGLELEPSDDRLAGIEREVEQGIRESKQMEEREYHNAVKYFEGLKNETEDERAARMMEIEFDKESHDNMIRRYKQVIAKHEKAM